MQKYIFFYTIVFFIWAFQRIGGNASQRRKKANVPKH